MMNKSIMAKWLQEFTRALEETKEDPKSRWMQFSNVTRNGSPAVRTLVFRGLSEVEGKTCLRFVADWRSEKCRDLTVNPTAEVVSFFAPKNEQFRISGPTKIISSQLSNQHEQIREQSFQEMSNFTRAQFVWPKSDTDDASLADVDALSLEEKERCQIAYKNFAVILLDPTLVDYLRLPKSRTKYILNQNSNTWEEKKAYA
eukprot:TRINITY_DN8607_c1_g2_i1.p1 TRINITY_DN8607_c1_g2~~TRINITY_DN8607_c1_g2_i1.p1  ORF type:complete len:201 (+),score=26.81 TRINITY_DN8607_c1_g2_i1:80-682(+)